MPTTKIMRPKVFVIEDKPKRRPATSTTSIASTTTTCTTPSTTSNIATSSAVLPRVSNQRANQNNNRIGQARRFKQQTTTPEPAYDNDYQGNE